MLLSSSIRPSDAKGPRGFRGVLSHAEKLLTLLNCTDRVSDWQRFNQTRLSLNCWRYFSFILLYQRLAISGLNESIKQNSTNSWCIIHCLHKSGPSVTFCEVYANYIIQFTHRKFPRSINIIQYIDLSCSWLIDPSTSFKRYYHEKEPSGYNLGPRARNFLFPAFVSRSIYVELNSYNLFNSLILFISFMSLFINIKVLFNKRELIWFDFNFSSHPSIRYPSTLPHVYALTHSSTYPPMQSSIKSIVQSPPTGPCIKQ